MLKSIELIGFKSFANKTTLEFPARVTAVVGPNGSGKSNVVDAFRWILGERGAQNLRSENQGSLIFSGSHKKTAMSFAEAWLHFDNTSGVFPVEFSEFSLGRRVERDGTSRFFLNREEVRLKDIIEMCARAKIGTKGVTIVNQGEVDHFIRVTPEKRRELIEEAVGLKEYQLKQNETITKLASAEQNLVQTKTLLEEITPHLRSLKRSAERYTRREGIAIELASAVRTHYSDRYNKITQELDTCENAFQTMATLVSQKNTTLALEEEKLKHVAVDTDRTTLFKAKQGRRDKERERQDYTQKLYALEHELTKKLREQTKEGEPGYALLRSTIEEIESTCETLLHENDIVRLRESLRALVDRIKSLFKKESKEGIYLEEYEIKKKELEKCIEALNGEIDGLLKQEEHEEVAYDERTRSFSNAIGAVDVLRREVFTMRSREDGLRLERERLGFQVDQIKEKVQEAGMSFNDFLARRNEVQMVGAQSALGLEEKITRLKRELSSIGEMDDALLAELKSTEDRHVFLTEQSGDLIKATDDLRSLIEELSHKIKTDFDIATEKLNKEFTYAFGKLSDGGKARLVITKESKGEEGVANVITGVDIKIDLPRKKITSLDMLSGGERTLVALAFMCALVAVSEPPFLVLDEVDAALDEQNAVKFKEIMGDLAKKTQFVIITHNRATMEAADVLYGVTMADDGISKILSLKLT
ncbi:MAG: AAA family ATPase [Parcubacteria group bacterium]|nr:AAA family ATPase [Parcubacteria group bacterium]